jgi:transcriptional regulator with XRE-family HTH domain
MRRKNQQATRALEKLIGEPVTFGMYMKRIRESEGLTLHEFAAKLGISVQHLCNVEHGRKHVSIERADAWAKTLQLPEVIFVQLSLQDQFRRAGLDGYTFTLKSAS